MQSVDCELCVVLRIVCTGGWTWIFLVQLLLISSVGTVVDLFVFIRLSNFGSSFGFKILFRLARGSPRDLCVFCFLEPRPCMRAFVLQLGYVWHCKVAVALRRQRQCLRRILHDSNQIASHVWCWQCMCFFAVVFRFFHVAFCEVKCDSQLRVAEHNADS